MRRFYFLFCCLAMAGCRHPIHVTTTGRIMSEIPPASNASPVFAQVVPGGASQGGPRVALVDIEGLLLNADLTGASSFGENPVSLFRERLEAAGADPCVRAVVVRINSFGGGVTASDVMRHDLLAFKQRTGFPVVASILDVGTGGGYYLATAADQIVAQPSSILGGIGVLMNVYDLTGPMTNAPAGAGPQGEGGKGVTADPIRAGEFIDAGSPVNVFRGEPYTEKIHVLQKMADQFHARFVREICQSRPVNAADATNFDGRVFTAPEGLRRRFIDQQGYLDDAVQLARELAGQPQAEVVLYHRSNDRARSPYSTTPNVPALSGNVFGMSNPGLDRTRLPGFLFMWQPEPTMEKLAGR